MKSDAPTVSNVPAPPSAGNSFTPISTPRRSRIVFLYSRRFKRRITMRPPWSLSTLRAATSVVARLSRNSVLASGSGCFASSGGISPELIWLRIFCQRSAASTESNVSEILSSRSFPSCFSALWHVTQYFTKKPRCVSGIATCRFSGDCARKLFTLRSITMSTARHTPKFKSAIRLAIRMLFSCVNFLLSTPIQRILNKSD